jgi:bacterioferritin-associated ferredoxin
MAYACLCEGVTDEAVDEVIAAGATSVDAVGEACGAGTGCGSCTMRLEEMLAAATVRACAPVGAAERAVGERPERRVA